MLLAHNGLVAGSSPAGPTNDPNDLAQDRRSSRRFNEPKRSESVPDPGSLVPDDWPDESNDDCWNCGGEGVVYSCVEEWACMDPDYGCDFCASRCDVCRPRLSPPRSPSGEGERT